MKKTPLIELIDLEKTFISESGQIQVLKNVNLKIYPGEKVSLIGPSGCGKSTLLSLISGLIRPSKGTVKLDGVDLKKLNDEEQSRFRTETIGVALQSENMIPFLNALENIELALSFSKNKYEKSRAYDLLKKLGVGHLALKYPRQISGGEGQRVALAVALANNPKLLIADEMVAQLDVHTASKVVKEIFESDMTVIFVTHNIELANRAEIKFCIKNKQVVKI
jgi:putative ABC transport system ATP-binding protein